MAKNFGKYWLLSNLFVLYEIKNVVLHYSLFCLFIVGSEISRNDLKCSESLRETQKPA